MTPQLSVISEDRGHNVATGRLFNFVYIPQPFLPSFLSRWRYVNGCC